MLSKEQLEDVKKWLNEGKFIEDWLRVNGIQTQDRDEAIADIMSDKDKLAPNKQSIKPIKPVVTKSTVVVEDDDEDDI